MYGIAAHKTFIEEKCCKRRKTANDVTNGQSLRAILVSDVNKRETFEKYA